VAAETVLIVEDEASMLRGLTDNFVMAGYRVETATDGELGLDAALNAKPDLIILDIMLPKINGYEICRSIRAAELDMPIIMLTAKDQESDIILGLNLGADDYVTKPFSIKELLARANRFLRRRSREEGEWCRFGSFTLNQDAKQLLEDEKEVALTPKELGLLVYFLKNEGRALTRDQILNAVWGYDIIVTQRSVDRCINSLRNKIEANPRRPRYIRTAREIGYRFEND
jgi:two-component system alkaline phosphatase synthesis response regulator PhoP